MVNKSKNKGTAAETAVKNYLFDEHDFMSYRLVLSGSKDRGDVAVFGLPLTIEVKNCATMKLAEWVDEAQKEKANSGVPLGVVWHKRKGKGLPKDWYVTMTGEEFVTILTALRKAAGKDVILESVK